MTFKTDRINIRNKVTGNILSGKVDEKGRKTGTLVTQFECDFVEIEDTSNGYYRMEPGKYFVAIIQSSKDGKSWGATQRAQYFKTSKERDTAVSKRLEKAEK